MSEVFEEAGHLVPSYTIVGAWVAEQGGAPVLDAGGSIVTIQHLKLENEGLEMIPP